MRGWLVVCVALLGCGKHEDKAAPRLVTGSGGGGSSEADFAAQLAAVLPDRHLVYDADKHQMTGSNEVISTTNIYQEWLKTDPGERRQALQKIASGFTEMPKDKITLDEARKKLRPAVRAVSYFDPQQLKKLGSGVGSAADTTTIPFKELGDGAAVAIAIDGDQSMAIATNKDLEDWKITLDQALAIAVTNLAVDAKFEQIEPGVWAARMNDSYDASRIMLVEDIGKLGLAGGPVALIPNRETLLLAGRTDTKALMRIAELAEAAAKDPRPIHTQALCLDGSEWHDCIPNVTPRVKQRFASLAAQGWIDLYGDGHDAYQDQLGDDLFVAHLTGIEKKTGEVLTYATWTKTVPTMLPKADYIAFVVLDGPEGEEKAHMLGLARWNSVMTLLGDHMKETGKKPRYWATGDYFPTDAELRKLALTMKP
ncbi:MAG: hypothetical protein JO257_13035 [Deltaproteobacteria bacterium]|nr:hypothetical protein [Deltaproteobacteria bacterium]